MAQHTRLLVQMRPALLMTPGIQLGLRLLRASKAELQDLVTQELQANPVLEEEDEDGAPGAETDAVPEAAQLPAPAASDPIEAGETEPELPEWAELLPPWEGEREDAPPGRSSCETWTARVPTLHEILLRQLRLETREPMILSVGEYLIGCLDERGYLAAPVAVVARDLGAPPALVNRALAAVQALEPPGVGARNLRECLLLQLRARPRREHVAEEIVRRCFAPLARGSRSEICRTLRIPAEVCERAFSLIRSLRPAPAAALSGRRAAPIDPDLIVEQVGSVYEVRVNDRGLPRVRLGRAWSEWARGKHVPADAGEYLQGRLRSARWFLQACQRRRATMIRVMECILDEQRDFFEQGVAGLRPLTLRRVAGALGFHESTVARVIREKYVQTPRGVFPLKYFFGGGLATGQGGATAARAVGEKIRLLCQEEDPQAPRSDEEIARILRQEGIQIARRTVAKYRARFRIDRAGVRRRRGALAAGHPVSGCGPSGSRSPNGP